MRVVAFSVVLSLGVLLGGNSLWAQSYFFGSKNGKIILIGAWEEEIITVKSNQVVITLDYATAEIKMSLPISTLQTNHDSLTLFLQQYPEKVIEYKGKLDLDFINTSEHPTLTFDVKGEIIFDSCTFTQGGTGKLEHFANEGELACFLNLEFYVNLPMTDQTSSPGIFKSGIKVQITDSVLRRE